MVPESFCRYLSDLRHCKNLVRRKGFEPLTSSMSRTRSLRAELTAHWWTACHHAVSYCLVLADVQHTTCCSGHARFTSGGATGIRTPVSSLRTMRLPTGR